jgi:hypothetical protein
MTGAIIICDDRVLRLEQRIALLVGQQGPEGMIAMFAGAMSDTDGLTKEL